MPTEIVTYREEHVAAVEEFNTRMRQAGMPAEYELPERPQPVWLPKTTARGPWNEHYLVLVNGVVRGVFVLKHEDFSFKGTVRSVACCHHAYSEGSVNRAYATIAVQILRYCVAKHPLIYAMGMQGYGQPMPRMLVKMGWSHCLLPFQLKILNPKSFFENVRVFRRDRIVSLLTTVAQKTGVAGLGVRTAQQVCGLFYRPEKTNYEVVHDLGVWADPVWKECEPCYTVLPLRTAETLRVLYPTNNRNFLRLRVTRGRETLGWAVVGHIQRNGDRNYGNLYMGAVLDTLAKPQHATSVVSAATQVLEGLGVDVIISNQSHVAWNHAFRQCGFLRAPSNYIFATSKKMADHLLPFQQTVPTAHFNRSGADGLFPYFFLGSNPLVVFGSRSSHQTNKAFAS